MTTKEKLVDILVNKGMFEKQAKEVIELAIPVLDKMADDYKITYDSDWTGYPSVLYSVWYVSIKPIALKWIDDNKPNAWFREMFI
jgi:hypothetical protein